MAISYLNGKWFPVGEAQVSVMDRGFLFGDGVYEVIPVYNSQAFCLEQHLARLNSSLNEIYLTNPMRIDSWTELIQTAIDKGGESYGAFYIQVTRGADKKRDFAFPTDVQPTIYMMINPAPQLRRQRTVTGYDVITLDDFRWSNGHIKSISLIAAGMLKNAAIRQGANEAILIKDGKVTECTASNLFAVFNGVLVTPPKSHHLLHGITRDLVIKQSRAAGLKVKERAISASELVLADELFLTSTTHESWPITKLNGTTVGNGAPGLIWQKVDQLFQANKPR